MHVWGEIRQFKNDTGLTSSGREPKGENKK